MFHRSNANKENGNSQKFAEILAPLRYWDRRRLNRRFGDSNFDLKHLEALMSSGQRSSYTWSTCETSSINGQGGTWQRTLWVSKNAAR